EGRALIARRNGLRDFMRHQHGSDGNARSEALVERDQIRPHADLLAKGERAGTARARLDLIEDEDRPMPVADGAEMPVIFGGRLDDTRHALDGLQDDGSDVVVLGERAVDRGLLAEGYEGGRSETRPVWISVFLVPRDGETSERSAVKAALHGHDLPAPGHLPGQFESRFVRLGPRIAEEDIPQSRRCCFREHATRTRTNRAIDRIGIEEDVFRLPANGLDYASRRMPQQGHAMATVEVQISPALCIPDVAAFSTLDRDRHFGIGGDLKSILLRNDFRGRHEVKLSGSVLEAPCGSNP